MALTEQEKQDLKRDIISQIKSESQGVNELQEVSSLDGVKTLPAMRGEELVTAPISLLGKPASDAAAQAQAAKQAADTAATNAVQAAANAATKAQEAQEAAQAAGRATGELEQVRTSAQRVIEQFEGVAVQALNGATVRFDGILTDATIETLSVLEVTGVYYVTAKKIFAGKNGNKYYNNWKNADLYLTENRKEIRKNKLYLLGSVIYAWNGTDDELTEITGSGGGNTINVTSAYPLETGYYTLATAIKAVEEKKRVRGCCITFEESQGKWRTKQFIGTNIDSWAQEASWEDFGGAGTIKSLTVNGRKQTADAEGNVSLTIDNIDVDESLDADSSNPVQNKAVATKLSEVEAGTVFGMTAELSDDANTVRLALTNKSGAEIASADIPAGGGGGGGDSSATKIVLTAGVGKTTIKEGDVVKLTYTYDHRNTDGESTGQKAAIQIMVKRGATTTYNETVKETGKGTYTLDLTKYLLLGTNDIYVIATTTDPTTGKAQRKQCYVPVKSVTLSLSTGYNLASGLSSGGYSSSEMVSVPFSVSGSGTKTVFLYVDGTQRNTETITRSGTTNGSFNLSMSGLSVGRHTVQMVAEMEADTLTLKSESIYFDFLKAGGNSPFIGLMITHPDGRIQTAGEYLKPVISVGQYESCEFRFVVYDPSQTPATVSVRRNDTLLQTVSVPRTMQTYQNRFTEKGRQTMTLTTGAATYSLYIDVEESGIDISEASYGLQVRLSPAGRSNGESDPAKWESNGVKTAFEGFDWSSNGWTGDSLKLSNGAKAVIGYELFREDAGANGMTIEMEFKVTNVMDRTAEVISCMASGKGLSVTSVEASIKTGTILHYVNEEGADASREIKIGTKFAPEEWLKVAFVIGKRTEGRLMELYVNGSRGGHLRRQLLLPSGQPCGHYPNKRGCRP